MKKLEITTVIGCKVGCSYCPQSILVKNYKSRGGLKILKLEDFVCCIDKLESNVDINFTGYSEPWLNPECTEMVLYAHEKGHRLGVSTTLEGMTFEDIEKIKHIPFEFFWVHLPSKESYMNLKVDDEYLEKLRSLIQTEIKSQFHYHGKAVHPKLEQLEKNIKEIVLFDRAMNVTNKNDDLPENMQKSFVKKGKIACDRIYQNVLLPNGDITLCCMDYGNKHVLGNLLKSSVLEITNSQESKFIKDGLVKEDKDILCRKCHEGFDVDLRAKIYNRFLPKIKTFAKKLWLN